MTLPIANLNRRGGNRGPACDSCDSQSTGKLISVRVTEESQIAGLTPILLTSDDNLFFIYVPHNHF
jgi:hypothetical protein